MPCGFEKFDQKILKLFVNWTSKVKQDFVWP